MNERKSLELQTIPNVSNSSHVAMTIHYPHFCGVFQMEDVCVIYNKKRITEEKVKACVSNCETSPYVVVLPMSKYYAIFEDRIVDF